MKGITSVITAAAMICTLGTMTACGNTDNLGADSTATETLKIDDTTIDVETTVKETTASAITSVSSEDDESETNTETKSKLKIGLICLLDESSVYDLNFINAMKETQETLGLSDEQVIIKTNIPESEECRDAAKELADSGCNVIFANSFGHEQYMLETAKEYPEIQFCHATGTLAHTENINNFHDAFASIYEGRYLTGIAAGMKLNEMIESGEITEEQAVIGYVGAFTYPEVISGYTAFYLGARSVCPSVTMKVLFTGSWYDEPAEKEAARTLISDGCGFISQHADSFGVPSACEEAGVPNISYNGSTLDSCPNTFIVSSCINWSPYYEYIIRSVQNGNIIDHDWTGDLTTGSVQLTKVNGKAAAEGTQEIIDETAEKLENGLIHVFDTSAFTVNGETLTSYMADVDTDAASTPDTEVISDGYFHESEYRSAPYFDITIDGITQLNTKF